jgi:molybdate transport system substrate-binding protein
MRLRPFVTAAKIAATILLAQSFAAGAAEIKVLSAGGIRPPLEELASRFERTSAHKVALRFVGGALMKQELQAGSAFDVVIAEASVLDEFLKAGKLDPATRAEVARAGVGMGIRAGAPKPEIASVDAFKRALLNAKSVAYSKEGMAGLHFLGVLERLGISKEMQPKLIPTVAGDPARGTFALVSRGEAELGIGAIATIFTPGIDFVGPIPAELQRYIQFAAAVGTAAKEATAGAELIKFITTPAAASVLKDKGMEPAPQR